ncbi:MAG: NADPH-dependent FMN reductase [Marinospirillum sp.]|uniref:NADPH-dependent FMN reductase n=1 Tax=Marinospirillum sp. TaxID=2183934 RepID=UPI0019DA9B24|nr:NADPH-dependent FMN reductase [Marinospirillum sp.]MBE0507556.1 NADPH-dependent FMN reductase [Marinospirillum sp.]
MNIVTVAASPAEQSRSIFLLRKLESFLKDAGAQVQSWTLDDFDPAALVYTRFEDSAIKAYQQSIREADVVVFATPVYKAAYSGGLKLLLDVIPEQGLKSKAVLSLATGGSNAHLLVLDYVLKPVVANLGARVQLPGIYVGDQDLKKDGHGSYQLTEALQQRLSLAAEELVELLETPDLKVSTPGEREHSPLLGVPGLAYY